MTDGKMFTINWHVPVAVEADFTIDQVVGALAVARQVPEITRAEAAQVAMAIRYGTEPADEGEREERRRFLRNVIARYTDLLPDVTKPSTGLRVEQAGQRPVITALELTEPVS